MGIVERLSLVELGFPSSEILRFPLLDTPIPPSPFKNALLTEMYGFFMKALTPMTIALVYFTLVHFCNLIIRRRQIAAAQKQAEKDPKAKSNRLPAAPLSIAKTPLFKVLVLLHNVFLCVYSAWTFIGMTSTMKNTSRLFVDKETQFSSVGRLFQAVCDLEKGVLSSDLPWKNLNFFGFWFYISKFYEVLDTIIILLKGRPSSLLQSYHHSGAMMCMWAGIRYQSPPIWIFVVFNSFIHTLMYFYFSLSCLKIQVPKVFKRTLTSLQITQFIVGGSTAVLHAFLKYTDSNTGLKEHCIESPERAMALYINVVYLAPLTALFAAFYVESYLKRAK